MDSSESSEEELPPYLPEEFFGEPQHPQDYANRVIKMENLLWRKKEVEKENKDAALAKHVEEEEAESRFQPSRHLLPDGMCSRCRNRLATIVLIPCRHLCFCADCENGSDACLICHTHKINSIRVNQILK
ncbi:hypothetical protein M8C21_013605 [Ambrosia artemisiifolia]|uniref:RING-type domain-containing protein n=1 Tax=Ambrosia artemisiifolia TaxID=4212 RepID=A0AAD5CA34_AMBAR|nr:hypothetical protein M8C21_013605 [Ambrosia artemisiifolia]